jgi:hypothetical protein
MPSGVTQFKPSRRPPGADLAAAEAHCSSVGTRKSLDCDMHQLLEAPIIARRLPPHR